MLVLLVSGSIWRPQLINMFHFQTRKSTSVLLVAIMAIGLVALIGPPVASAQTDPSGIESISVGFDGKVVLGRWVPVRVKLADSVTASNLQFETLDGDAVPIRYMREAGGTTGLIRIGRAAGITVRVFDNDGKVVASRRFSLDELRESHNFLPGTAQLTLYLGIESREQQESLQPDRRLTDESAIVQDFQDLPDNRVGYESVETLVIVPQTETVVPAKTKVDAIDAWVRSGGRALITGGNAYEIFFEKHFPTGLQPGRFVRERSLSESGSIELFTGSTEQLVKTGGTNLPLTQVELAEGRQLVCEASEFPLIAHWMHGFGRVSFVSLNFASEPLSSWDGRNRLLTLAMDDTGTASQSSTSQSGRVSHIGYTDIVGQLRAAMDQFKRVPFITFTMVALLVGLFILAIGPGDFFFLRKVTGRMEMTWLTFSLICLAFSALAWLLATNLKSSETEMNQVEIVDVDAATGQLRGSLWTHVYSPKTGSYDIAMPTSNKLFDEQFTQSWITWQGLPGPGLGSMQSRSDRGLFQQQYDCKLTNNSSTLQNIPMQSAATRTFFGSWQSETDQQFISNLRESPNSDALLGSVTNPLDIDLYDAVVLFGDWVYILDNRPLKSGETIMIEDDLREKTIAGHYTRLGGKGNDDVSTAWDPSNNNLARVLQMMSFFDVIGGESYTRLTNDFHNTIDLSYQLRMGRAVLIGQVPSATTPLSVNGTRFDNYDKKLSLVRIVLPVNPRKK